LKVYKNTRTKFQERIFNKRAPNTFGAMSKNSYHETA
jgi:hypothetical protein